MSSREPARSAPSGQPRPFERQSVTVSKRAAISAGGTLLRRGRVEQARAVEMDGEAELARGRDDVVELVERPDAPARAVVRVLEREHRRALVGDLRARRGGGADLLGRDPPGRRPGSPRVTSPACAAAPPYS